MDKTRISIEDSARRMLTQARISSRPKSINSTMMRPIMIKKKSLKVNRETENDELSMIS